MNAAGHLERNPGRSLDLDRVVRFRRAEVRLHVEADGGLALSVADAFLDDPGDVSRIDGEELARRRHRGELGLDIVRYPVEGPPERVGDHRNRFREADV